MEKEYAEIYRELGTISARLAAIERRLDDERNHNREESAKIRREFSGALGDIERHVSGIKQNLATAAIGQAKNRGVRIGLLMAGGGLSWIVLQWEKLRLFIKDLFGVLLQ